MSKKTILPKTNPMQVMDGLKIVVEAYKENHRVSEIETTKREQIQADKKVKLAKIKSQRKILEQYLEGIFSERKLMINKMFDALDKGIERDNSDLIQQSLGSVVDIARESPLAGVQNLLSDYENPEVEVITI